MTKIFWHPVLRAKTLRNKPVRVMLEDEPLVLFRNGEEIACLRDMCPHRFAPLSMGKVVDGEIECPYHGWRFNGQGACTKIPLHDGPTPRRFVSSWAARESHGLIFVTRDAGAAAPLHVPTWDDQPFARSIIEMTCESTLADAVENSLDPTHTLFVHRGLLRGANDKHKTTLELTVGVDDGVLTVDVTGEEGQDGLLSRLLEGPRVRSHSSFRMPGVVEMEYWGPKNLNLVMTAYFTRTEGDLFRGFAVMTGPNRYGLGHLKSLLFVPMMRLVLGQDRRILGAAQRNWKQAGCPNPARSPLDVFRSGINAVIEGQQSLAPEKLTLVI